MIVLTVKTLDSQNHTFTVDDNITVEEFKTKIAETVNIPADTQRIIYCGRVLQDEAKLNDYDVNGKVVHLVQRAPPAPNLPTTRSSTPSPPSPAQSATFRTRPFRGFETNATAHGNAMYLGSMAFPSTLMESQGIVPPPPTHSLAGSRLNVARRMLRRAEAVVALLENPQARASDVPAAPTAEEQQEEEVTPIIEARIVVPEGVAGAEGVVVGGEGGGGGGAEGIDEAMVISAVESSLFGAGAANVVPQATDEVAVETATGGEASGESTPSAEEAPPSGDQQQQQQQRAGGSTANVRNVMENASRTSEMADLLAMLDQLQVRFAPFMQQYRQFMIDDPVVPQENVRNTQAMLSRVSEVLHFLGHAYHSLSDILIRARSAPPRPLLCRPILIQHSAVVQAGIPVQVEVINLAATAAGPSNRTPAPPATTEAGGNTATNANTNTTTPQPTGQANQNQGAPQPTASVNFRRFFPTEASIRVQSIPIDAHALGIGGRPISVSLNPPPQHFQAQQQQQQQRNNAGGTNPASANNATGAAGNGGNDGNGPSGGGGNSLEFFMEVTPEVMQGSLNGPPQEFIQSLVQMAGHIMNQVASGQSPSAQQQQQQQQPPTTLATTTEASSESPSSTNQNNQQQHHQNGVTSSARGNTQTNPTQATHTLSSPRPHVHVAQQAMQGGFDPFLPCNSHHVTHHRRRGQQGGGRQSQQSTARGQQQQQQQGQPDEEVPNLQHLLDAMYSAMNTGYGAGGVGGGRGQQRPGANDRRAGANAGGVAAGGGSNPTSGDAGGSRGHPQQQQQLPPIAALFSNLQNALGGLPNVLQGPTIADILQQLPPDDSPVIPGESIITDLIMLLSRNLTIVDMITLNTGNFEPLNRVTGEIRQFFNTRVLDNNGQSTVSQETAVERGVDRLITQMRPFFNNFNRLRARDDIDPVASVENLFRRRLQHVVTSAAGLSADTMSTFVEHCVTLARLTCGLSLSISQNGQQGIEETFREIVSSYMHGIPAELQNWTLVTSCTNLRTFMTSLNPENSGDVSQYIVRRTANTTDESATRRRQPENVAAEPMDVDSPPVQSQATAPLMSVRVAAEVSGVGVGTVRGASEEEEDDEVVPAIVLGSEPWHNQVPEDWVPIIARDVQRQRRHPPQPAFSDAYLSGMPTKRRKIVSDNKPVLVNNGGLPQVIAESVRRAVTSTGLASVAPVEAVAQAAGDSTDVQTAYRSLLRTSVQTVLRDNEDFTPDRFPNASNYFNFP